MISRVHPSAERRRPSASTTVGNTLGGLGERLRELVLAALVGEVGRDVAQTVRERVPGLIAELVAAVLLDGLLHPRLELLVALSGARDADDGELVRQQPPERER